MSASIDIALPELYRGKANLWVEDTLTRDYLKECWEGDPDILFLIAGGNSNLQAVVKDAEAKGYHNVFGVRDRDFRQRI